MRECAETIETLAAYQDGELDAPTQARFQAHLATCDACRATVQEEALLRRHLRGMVERQSTGQPPIRLWKAAQEGMDAHEGRRRRRYQLQFALVGACLLLLILGVVWARLASPPAFPSDVVLRDFRTLRGVKAAPEEATSDPDKAARWLRGQLNAEIPPVNLSLSHARLIGADMLKDAPMPLGRLLYRTPQGLAAVYIAPHVGHFQEKATKTLEERPFYLNKMGRDVGLYGWETGQAGYALVVPQPIAARESMALDAAHSTDSH